MRYAVTTMNIRYSNNGRISLEAYVCTYAQRTDIAVHTTKVASIFVSRYPKTLSLLTPTLDHHRVPNSQ